MNEQAAVHVFTERMDLGFQRGKLRLGDVCPRLGAVKGLVKMYFTLQNYASSGERFKIRVLWILAESDIQKTLWRI